MPIHTMGTNAASSLQAVQWWPALTTVSSTPNRTLSLADALAIANGIASTSLVGSLLNQQGASGILLTASTHGNTTLDTFVSTAGSPLSAVVVGALVLGAGIPVNTYIVAKTPATGTPTSVTLSQAAVGTNLGVRIIFANPPQYTGGEDGGFDPSTGRVKLPDGRGIIQLNPGDYIAVDNTGAVIVVPANSVAYAGSVWTFT